MPSFRVSHHPQPWCTIRILHGIESGPLAERLSWIDLRLERTCAVPVPGVVGAMRTSEYACHWVRCTARFRDKLGVARP